MTRILLVEDEESYRDPLTYQLSREGFDVVTAATGTQALAEYDRVGADLVLLDLMLPGLSGTEVCRQLRARGDVPIIMLTAKDSEIDKVVGLELGADDYVTKPYSFRELLARVRAVLRRRESTAPASGAAAPAGDPAQAADPEDDTLELGPVRMDVERHVVQVNGQVVAFPLKEFELLELLLRHAGRVLTRGQLIDRVWGSDYVGDTKTLDVHVKRVRAKIEADPANPRLLLTVRGLGYKLTDDVPA
ncbi:response regulator transcription factor [Cellulomonas cellasea]|uniref:response regulator transcription factor n=1 Tax=Cellulomonas cellasea TaxID=43670 RepID=UPI0025A37EAB|nr:response regulator transcription factor [Cellulomonas cellasea]MDM8083479.1 response regulator transcription factor [Cellulomonas cellasea]